MKVRHLVSLKPICYLTVDYDVVVVKAALIV